MPDDYKDTYFDIRKDVETTKRKESDAADAFAMLLWVIAYTVAAIAPIVVISVWDALL